MNNSKTSLFLMELIISILFFSISAVVCVQLFVNAHTTNQATADKANSNIVIQNIAESINGCNGSLEQVSDIFEYSVYNAESNTLTIGYDSQWNECSGSSERTYTATAIGSTEDTIITVDIEITDSDHNIIMNQTIKHHVQLTAEVDS